MACMRNPHAHNPRESVMQYQKKERKNKLSKLKSWVGSCGMRTWPASLASGPLVLGLGLSLDYQSLSKERNWSLR